VARLLRSADRRSGMFVSKLYAGWRRDELSDLAKDMRGFGREHSSVLGQRSCGAGSCAVSHETTPPPSPEPAGRERLAEGIDRKRAAGVFDLLCHNWHKPAVKRRIGQRLKESASYPG